MASGHCKTASLKYFAIYVSVLQTVLAIVVNSVMLYFPNKLDTFDHVNSCVYIVCTNFECVLNINEL